MYDNQHWRYVSGGTGTGFDDNDDTEGMKPVMIKVVLLNAGYDNRGGCRSVCDDDC